MSNDEAAGSDSPPRSWFNRLTQAFSTEPTDREQLLELIRGAGNRALLDSDALAMIEGVVGVADLRVRDIMIPRAEMDVIERDASLEDILPVIIESAHSRYPVITDDRAEVIGIMLAKDLLQYCGRNSGRFNIRDVLRSAVFVPESKRLNVLLKDFRTSRNHMAIVIDEYGAAAGLVTIEDVLEQIVGEIEDEYDFDEDMLILKRGEREYTAKAQVTIEDFNERFGTALDEETFDTLGGLVTNAIGHLPKRGEKAVIDRFEFTVVRADSRKIRLLKIRELPQAQVSASADKD